MDKRELIEELFFCMNDDDFVELWNEYCNYDYMSDETIYYMEQFNELMEHCTPLEILDSVDSSFDTYDDYFTRDNYYETFESFNDPVYHVELNELIDDIIDNDDDFGNYDIRELLDSEEFELAS